MKAVILAAGYGGRMSPLTKEIHKTLLKVNGERIMDLIIKSLINNNIKDIVIVTGYKKEQLKNHLINNFNDIPFQFIHNEKYATTNNIFSLALAFEQIKFDKDIIMIESDLIYSSDVIEKAINSKFKNLALISPYKIGMDGTVVEVLDDKIIGLYPPHLQGENFNLFDKFKTLNIYKFSKEFCKNEFKKLLVYYAKSIDDNCYYELILGILIYMQRQEIFCEIVPNEKWVEVDDPNDLIGAEFHFNKKNRMSILEHSFGGYWNYDIIDAIQDIHYQEGDKVYVYCKDSDTLKLVQDFDGEYCEDTYYTKLYNTLCIFETLLDPNLFPNYKLKKNKELL